MGLFPKERDLNRPPEELELVVDGSYFRTRAIDLVVRLDQFLGAHLTWRSRTSIQELVRDGYVLVDPATPEHPEGTGQPKRERRPGRKLRHGSRVTVVIPEELRLPTVEGSLPGLDILYEDDAVLVVNKPPHLVVHPSGRHTGDTLIQRVHAQFLEQIQARREAPRLAHRIDRETSGAVVVAKHPRSHRELRLQFEAGTVEKTYLAIVWGSPSLDAGSVALPIGPARASRIRLKMAVREDGLSARTDWTVVERMPAHSLIACQLHTGRQHQIRVHLAALGTPIVGDKLYGPDDEHFIRAAEDRLLPEHLDELELDRQALHHHVVTFRTPDGNRPVTVTCPLAPDLESFLSERPR